MKVNRISFQGSFFGIRKNPIAVDLFSASLVVLVGPSGSGKSVVVDGLKRVLDRHDTNEDMPPNFAISELVITFENQAERNLAAGRDQIKVELRDNNYDWPAKFGDTFFSDSKRVELGFGKNLIYSLLPVRHYSRSRQKNPRDGLEEQAKSKERMRTSSKNPSQDMSQFLQTQFLGLFMGDSRPKVNRDRKEKLKEIQNAVRKVTGLELKNIDGMHVGFKEKDKISFDLASSGHKEAIFIIMDVILNGPSSGGFIFLDEPDLHIDPKMVSRMLRVLLEAAQKKSSQLWIATHSPSLVQTAWLQGGTIIKFRNKQRPDVIQDTKDRELLNETMADLTGQKNAFLFGKRVFIVEGSGKTDPLLFDVLLGERSYTFLGGGSKKDVKKMQDVFVGALGNTIGQPIKAAVDSDDDFENAGSIDGKGVYHLKKREIEFYLLDKVALDRTLNGYKVKKTKITDAVEKICKRANAIEAGQRLGKLREAIESIIRTAGVEDYGRFMRRLAYNSRLLKTGGYRLLREEFKKI